MGFIKLNTITWVNPPTAAKQCTIKYRLTSDADVAGSYTNFSTTAMINPDGTIQGAPLYITGLNDETSYTVKINANCGGSSAVEEFVTGVLCPDVVGIDGEGNAGNPPV